MSTVTYSERGLAASSPRVGPSAIARNIGPFTNEIDLPLVRALYAATSDLSPAELDALAMLFRDRARDLRAAAVIEMRRAAA